MISRHLIKLAQDVLGTNPPRGASVESTLDLEWVPDKYTDDGIESGVLGTLTFQVNRGPMRLDLVIPAFRDSGETKLEDYKEFFTTRLWRHSDEKEEAFRVLVYHLFTTRDLLHPKRFKIKTRVVSQGEHEGKLHYRIVLGPTVASWDCEAAGGVDDIGAPPLKKVSPKVGHKFEEVLYSIASDAFQVWAVE